MVTCMFLIMNDCSSLIVVKKYISYESSAYALNPVVAMSEDLCADAYER